MCTNSSLQARISPQWLSEQSESKVKVKQEVRMAGFQIGVGGGGRGPVHYKHAFVTAPTAAKNRCPGKILYTLLPTEWNPLFKTTVKHKAKVVL